MTGGWARDKLRDSSVVFSKDFSNPVLEMMTVQVSLGRESPRCGCTPLVHPTRPRLHTSGAVDFCEECQGVHFLFHLTGGWGENDGV